jgi:hypothetical protein
MFTRGFLGRLAASVGFVLTVCMAGCVGSTDDAAPESPGAVDASATDVSLDATAPDQADGPAPSAAQPVPPSAPHPKGHSLGLSGRTVFSLHNFAMNDKEGRKVLHAKKVTGSLDLNALQRGTFKMVNAKAHGVEVTLYRDAEGKISLAGALKKQPPHVQQAAFIPPERGPKEPPWLLDMGPIEVEDATLTIGFTKKPVIFHVDSATVSIKRGPKDPGPMIYIQEVQAQMMKPKPLPKPVRIAWANGLVDLKGKPLVHLAARTCIRKSELRIDAIVEERKQPVHLKGDSAGMGGALGRMGIKIAARHKSEKMSYEHAAVHINGGPGCKDAELTPSEAAEQADHAAQSTDAGAAPAPESRHQRRKERRQHHKK